MKKYLQQSIIDGKIELSLQELNDFFQHQEQDKDLLHLVILTNSRYQDLLKDKHKGIIREDDFEMRLQKIKDTCLHLINKIPDDRPPPKSGNKINDELITVLTEITAAYNSALTVRRETIQLGLKYDKDEKGIEKRDDKNRKIRLVKKEEYIKQMKSLNNVILELESILLKININKIRVDDETFMKNVADSIKVIIEYLKKIYYESQQKMRQFDETSKAMMLSKLMMLEDFIWGQENKITGFSKQFKYQYNFIVALFKEVMDK